MSFNGWNSFPSVRGYPRQDNDDLIAMTVDRDKEDIAINLSKK